MKMNMANEKLPDWMLINGKAPFMNSLSKSHESLEVTQGNKSTTPLEAEI